MNSNSQDQAPIPPIPAEAVEAAARVLTRLDFKRRLSSSAYRHLQDNEGVLSNHTNDRWADIAKATRAALTAAAPLLAGWRKLEGEPDPTKAPWDGDPVDLWDIYRQAREPMMRFDGCHYFVSQDKTHRTSWKCFGFYMRVPVPPAEGTP